MRVRIWCLGHRFYASCCNISSRIRTSTKRKTSIPTTSSIVLEDYATQIGIISRERTWDLMPPEVVRPLATTKLGTLITIAHRLRMQWGSYQVTEGVFHAQGAGHAFTSSTVRGLGIVSRYDFTATTVGDHRRPSLDTPRKILRMRG